MVKILHVVHTMECGGIETMLMNIFRKIDRSRFQFDFLVNGTEDNYYSDQIKALGGTIIGVTPKRVNFKRNINETINVMRKGKYDIVHIHQDSMIGIGIYCAKKAGIKTIFTHAHTTSANGWYRKMLAILSRKYICDNSDLKFACSNSAAEWIYGSSCKDIVIFKNAINAKQLTYDYPTYASNRKRFHINDDVFVLGMCGRFSNEKNLIFLLKVFNEIKMKIPESKLLLVGDGPEKQAIIDSAIEMNIFDDVILPGMVSDTNTYYSIMDYFVLPSLFEGLPLVGIEAQAAGLPTVFSYGVTKEVKITDNVQFLDLNSGVKHWADVIISSRKPRKNTYKVICENGYDIGENILYLSNKYVNKVCLYENRESRE